MKDARRLACEELARFIVTDEGLRYTRLMAELPRPRGVEADRPAPQPARGERKTAARPRAAVPIGIWTPQPKDDGELQFVRAGRPGLDDLWAATPVLPAKGATTRRACFFGESAAAGWLYAPHLTPALVLESQLRELAGPGAWEVLDLTKVDLAAFELIALASSVHQLQPDVVVVYAGNNWTHAFHPPPPGFPVPPEAAQAFRREGMGGLSRMCRETTRALARTMVGHLARLAEAIPVVVVVPEQNLSDFDRSAPVAWLPGDGCARWYEARAEAEAALAAGQAARAEEAARRMAELDGATCSTTDRLLARALAAQGRLEEARQACLDEVEHRAWSAQPFIPGAIAATQEVLRGAAGLPGLRVVDLAQVFAAHGGSCLPGRRYFLDYCHLSPEGMKVSMAAAAAEVLALFVPPGQGPPSWTEVLARGGEAAAPAAADGRAKFMAALYSRHWTPTDEACPVFQYWIDQALAASDGVLDTMSAYAAARCEPAEAQLFSTVQQRFFAAMDRSERLIWSMPHLDPEGLETLGRILRGRSRPGGALEERLLQAHGVGGGERDLLQPVYQWGRTDQLRPNASLADNLPAFYAARLPRSHFSLVCEGGRSVVIDLTARLPAIEQPRRGELVVSVGGRRAGALTLEDAWRRRTLHLPAELLRRGINRLTLEWPPLPAEGDAALRRIGLRLDQRVAVDLHPVFGELMRLRARRSE